MSNVSEAYVPSVGPLDAKIMIIGEAPGADEEAGGEPFIGKSGQFLERYLNRLGFQRRDVRLSNLCHYRPRGNKFELLLGTKELNDGLAELDAEIASMTNLNLIVAVGAWPMYYTTGCTASKGKAGTGIMSWRGSVVPGSGKLVPSCEGKKVLITYHPAFIIRPQGFGFHPIFFNDLRKIKKEHTSPLLEYPKVDYYIDPVNAHEIAEEMSRSPILTVDIETFGSSLACVGVTDRRDRGLCLTCQNPDGWDLARRLLASDQPKNFQFGTFDINYLWWHYQWEVGGYLDGRGFDTFIAAANLQPEFPKGLDFLTSLYTEMPYYKEDRKVHKMTGDLDTLWRYNIKDLVAQHWIMEDMIPELEELYGKPIRFS
jgi:uracil-DNA glycosylase family 4